MSLKRFVYAAFLALFGGSVVESLEELTVALQKLTVALQFLALSGQNVGNATQNRLYPIEPLIGLRPLLFQPQDPLGQ